MLTFKLAAHGFHHAGGGRRQPHAQPQAQVGQLLADFVERRLAEVPHFQQLVFGASSPGRGRW